MGTLQVEKGNQKIHRHTSEEHVDFRTGTFPWFDVVRCRLEKVVLCFLKNDNRQIRCNRIFQAYCLTMNSLDMDAEETVACQILIGAGSWNIILSARTKDWEEGVADSQCHINRHFGSQCPNLPLNKCMYLLGKKIEIVFAFLFLWKCVSFQNQCKRYLWLFKHKLYITK